MFHKPDVLLRKLPNRYVLGAQAGAKCIRADLNRAGLLLGSIGGMVPSREATETNAMQNIVILAGNTETLFRLAARQCRLKSCFKREQGPSMLRRPLHWSFSTRQRTAMRA